MNCVLLYVLIIVLLILLMPLLVFVCWNFVMPTIGVAVLPTVLHAYALCIMCWILFASRTLMTSSK